MSLKKIAQLTGTSTATVSRVLNHPAYKCSTPGLSEKIWAAAKELNYIPNTSARKLRKGTIPAEEPFVLDVYLTRFNSFEKDPFFKELYQHIQEELLQNGCLLGELLNSVDVMELFDHISENYGIVPYRSVQSINAEKSRNILSYIEKKKNTGLIILGKCPREFIDVLKRRYEVIAGIDRNPTDFEYDEVTCNGTAAAQMAIEYLISKGFQDIAYIGDCTYESRYIGYYQTFLDHRIPLKHTNIYPTDQTLDEGFAAMKRILATASPPAAIFCANDITAIGVLKALKSCRKRDYHPAVISIDNIAEAAKTNPMLTTIDIPKKEMVHLVIGLILDRKKKLHSEIVRMELPCKLVVRESCGYY